MLSDHLGKDFVVLYVRTHLNLLRVVNTLEHMAQEKISCPAIIVIGFDN